MKKINLIIAAAVFIFAATQVYADETKTENVPVGMELREIDGRKLYLPKDANFTKKGDLIVLESANEYVARKLEQIEVRISGIEAAIDKLNKSIEQINTALAEIQIKTQISRP